MSLTVPLRTAVLFDMELAVDGLIMVGGPPGAARRIGNISGGSFCGDRLRGQVMANGTDWQTERGDGVVMLDGRILLRTDDGALIAMTYAGMRHGPAEVMARLGRGEPVDSGDYYFRISPAFSTSDTRYAWLNRIVAVGVGQRLPAGPIYTVHEIV